MPPCAHLSSPSPCDANTLPPDAKNWLWKRPWCWERLKAGGEGDDRGWDGWMASPTRWTWVWAPLSDWTDWTPMSSGWTLGAVLWSALLSYCRNQKREQLAEEPSHWHLQMPNATLQKNTFFHKWFSKFAIFNSSFISKACLSSLYSSPIPPQNPRYSRNLSLENWPSWEVRWNLHLCSCDQNRQEVVEVSITWLGRGGTLVPLRSWEWVCPGAGVRGVVEGGLCVPGAAGGEAVGRGWAFHPPHCGLKGADEHSNIDFWSILQWRLWTDHHPRGTIRIISVGGWRVRGQGSGPRGLSGGLGEEGAGGGAWAIRAVIIHCPANPGYRRPTG